MTEFLGEWLSFSKTTDYSDYFNFVRPWEHGCPRFLYLYSISLEVFMFLKLPGFIYFPTMIDAHCPCSPLTSL